MGNNFARPKDGFRFAFGGMKLNEAADALPPDKYALAINVRAYRDNSVGTRPGQLLQYTTAGGHKITDLATYTAIETDNVPQTLSRDVTDAIYFGATAVGTLAGSGASYGAFLLPFRPNQSPQTWMYVTNGYDYQKFEGATTAGAVVAQKVGIAEPQDAPLALPLPIAALFLNKFNYLDGGIPVIAGSAGSSSGGQRITDTCGVVLADPGDSALLSVQVSATVQYQRFMKVEINGATNKTLVQDVFAGFPTPFSIQGIYYFVGTTGRCILVPNNLFAGPGTAEDSLYGPTLLGSLRRGALIQIGSEICLVWSVTEGPDGTIAIETSTTGTHTTAEMLIGIPSILVMNIAVAPGNAITSLLVYNGTVTAGIGTITIALASSPFANANASFQPEDYIHFSVNISELANLSEIKILWDVGDGSFTQNFYYYTVRPNDLHFALSNTATQIAAAQEVTQRATIDEEVAAMAANQGVTFSSAQTAPGSSQWAEIFVPISSLTHVGNDQTKTLQNVNSIQILINALSNIVVKCNSFSVSGGYSPDVGDTGAPYQYRVRPRSQVTGVVGNPSPATRYGVNPRREAVLLTLPPTYVDPQVDTWDIFRFGGTVTSWRYIGSAPVGQSSFVDNFDDAAAQAGDALDFDNFEPWPTIDVPNNGTATQICGTVAVVTSTDPDILGYLPGTLVRIASVVPGTLIPNLNVFTLETRPVSLGGTSYLLQFIENAGAGVNLTYQIQEPILANQHLPYIWGPDATGTVFGVGDVYRPGTISFSKNYAPDSVPDSYNQEITPPSEPLAGGEIVDGLAYVASPERWWALYPEPAGSPQRYSAVQQPFTRGIAAPYGHCNDGKEIYWWAKDGIYSSLKGSLTDADLFNLFPHDGVLGVPQTYGGVTIAPPDYTQVAKFRLTYGLNFLYATYVEINGTYHTLVCDFHNGRVAWSLDDYSPQVTAFYHPPQPAAGLTSASPQRYPALLMATTSGVIASQKYAANDLGGVIASKLARAEFDGGDIRAVKQWGDGFLDCVPAAPALVVTPMSLGAAALAANVTTVAQAFTRTRVPIIINGPGPVVADFLGVLFAWADDFSSQSVPTLLRIWEPSFDVQPAATLQWLTFGASFGNSGFMHIREVVIAWVSTQAVTLQPTSYDGLSPAAITIPSSGGAYRRAVFPLTANKGQLFKFAAVSAAPFQIFLDDSEVRVGAWGRVGPYATPKDFGTVPENAAVI